MGGDRSSSLAHLAGGGPPAVWPPTDALVIDRSEGGELSTFLFVDDEEDLIVMLAAHDVEQLRFEVDDLVVRVGEFVLDVFSVGHFLVILLAKLGVI